MSYTSKDIKVLDEITHIRVNPSMYIGDVSTPTHLLEEVLDNSLDECFDKYANIVAVKIDSKRHLYSIIDNGRGIPYDNDTPIIISSKLFSGAKFKNDKNIYKICTGLHGVGLVAVNALSSYYAIEIYRDKKARFEFEDCKLKSKTIEDFNENKPFSTKICFIPDKKIFHNLMVDVNRIRKRLLNASVELPNVHFVLIIDDKQEVIKLDKQTFFKNECLNESDSEKSGTFSFSVNDGPEWFNVMFSYSFNGTISPRIISSINLLPVDNGGTHVGIFTEILKDFFISRAKKLNIKVQPTDILCGLRAYISLDLINPEFGSQAKDKLVNKKDNLSKLSSKLSKAIELYFDKNDKEELENILRFFEDYRLKLESKKHKTSTNGRRASTKFTKLRDCTSPNGEIFIVEGDSAAGSLIQSRDPKIHAIFPLKGKIPNVMNAKDILKNKEIAELVQAFGCGIGPNFDISKLKYGKIICAADADPDGGHISSLVTMVMVILFPEIVKNGKFYLASTPLYSINESKEFKPLWTNQELENARNDGRTILRAKGLGELSPKQIKVCLMDSSTRKLIKIDFPVNLDEMIKLFTDPNEKRNLLKSEI